MIQNLTPKDIEYLDKAQSMPWEQIDISQVETEEAAELLFDMKVDKYHRDEHKCNML